MFERERLGKNRDAGFGGGVARSRGVAGEAINRRDADDLAVLGFEHRRQDRLRAKKHGFQIHIDDAVPVFGAHIDNVFALRAAGDIDQDIDLAPAVEGGFDHLPAPSFCWSRRW